MLSRFEVTRLRLTAVLVIYGFTFIFIYQKAGSSKEQTFSRAKNIAVWPATNHGRLNEIMTLRGRFANPICVKSFINVHWLRIKPGY